MNEALWYYYLSINAKEMSIQQNQWEKQPSELFDRTVCPNCHKYKFDCNCINSSIIGPVLPKGMFMNHETEQKMNDNVNHPKHYEGDKVECIDAIEEATKDLTGIEAVCTANIIKYSWRWKKKNGVEDLKKAAWYLNKLIKKLEDEVKGHE